jgi:hypothetical protein
MLGEQWGSSGSGVALLVVSEKAEEQVDIFGKCLFILRGRRSGHVVGVPPSYQVRSEAGRPRYLMNLELLDLELSFLHQFRCLAVHEAQHKAWPEVDVVRAFSS